MEMSFLQGEPHRKDMANTQQYPPFVSLGGVWKMYCLLFAFSIYFFIPFLAGAPLAFLPST